MLKAVIFDLDGLLVDSTPLHLEANQIFIESFGRLYLRPESGREGMRIIDIVRDYKDLFDLPGTVEELHEKRQTIFYELVTKELQLFPGAFELLEKVKKRDLKMALATSGDREYVNIVFEKWPRFKTFFTTLVVSEDVKRGKPYPDVYKKALEKLNIQSNEAVVLEDSYNGVAAAKGAGIQVIAVPNKHYPDADFTLADKSFGSLNEVAKAINLI